jgi:PIN domain nuclease of toxin-antitoxin system
VRALFDTHALLWAVLEPQRLGRNATSFLEDQGNEIYVSAASAWEIATKVRLGRLPKAIVFEERFEHIVTEVAGYTLLPIDTEMALRAGRLIGDHGDPFDRMIAAQALALDIPVLSLDAKLDAFGVRRIW